MSASKNLGIGLNLIILRDSEKGKEILLEERDGPEGANLYFPRGTFNFGDKNWEECAREIAKERAGAQIANLSYFTFTNDFLDGGLVVCVVSADYQGGIPLPKSQRNRKLNWYSINNLNNLYLPIGEGIREHSQNDNIM
jgi:ADP-ribose pyrophosphatase YjhB (NUDIX family)